MKVIIRFGCFVSCVCLTDMAIWSFGQSRNLRQEHIFPLCANYLDNTLVTSLTKGAKMQMLQTLTKSDKIIIFLLVLPVISICRFGAKVSEQTTLSYKKTTFTNTHARYSGIETTDITETVAKFCHQRDILVHWRSHLNHSRRLTVCELLQASLALHDVAHFNGKISMLLLLPNLQAWETRESASSNRERSSH